MLHGAANSAMWAHGQGATVLAMWVQRGIRFESQARGFHLITAQVLAAVPEITQMRVGILHLFLRHTSAALTLGENFSPDVRRDFVAYFDRAVPEDAAYWTHTLEGADDMPAHIKSALLGAALSLPIANQGLALGTWQGIYLCEFRDAGGPRSLVATVWGEPAS
jgi:secondary thiamine-phosphate synthase enzyme